MTTETVAKERPILFSGPMVRAILDGRKTQTRRVVKVKGTWSVEDGWPGFENDFGEWQWLDCQYGKPGDRLWVRETWTLMVRRHWSDPSKPRDWLCPWMKYGPTRNACSYRACCVDEDSERCREELGYKWRPSIHMPRWASRITLEVTGVRVERLQEIDELDALAEGFEGATKVGTMKEAGKPPVTKEFVIGEARDEFAELWDKINGAGSWDENPWVWVVEFKRI